MTYVSEALRTAATSLSPTRSANNLPGVEPLNESARYSAHNRANAAHFRQRQRPEFFMQSKTPGRDQWRSLSSNASRFREIVGLPNGTDSDVAYP